MSSPRSLLELLSNSHMANRLQYAATRVAPYLVATVERLRNIRSDLEDFTVIKSEHDELRWRVLILEKEKRKFKERYNLLDGEKAYLEEYVVSLDMEAEHLS